MKNITRNSNMIGGYPRVDMTGDMITIQGNARELQWSTVFNYDGGRVLEDGSDMIKVGEYFPIPEGTIKGVRINMDFASVKEDYGMYQATEISAGGFMYCLSRASIMVNSKGKAEVSFNVSTATKDIKDFTPVTVYYTSNLIDDAALNKTGVFTLESMLTESGTVSEVYLDGVKLSKSEYSEEATDSKMFIQGLRKILDEKLICVLVDSLYVNEGFVTPIKIEVAI